MEHESLLRTQCNIPRDQSFLSLGEVGRGEKFWGSHGFRVGMKGGGGREGGHRVIQSLMSRSGKLFISGMTSRVIGNS